MWVIKSQKGESWCKSWFSTL